MSEKARFHNLTKPIRFRKLKLFKQKLVLWCEALRERIKYLINNILYKLNILKLFEYTDTINTYIPLPYELKEKEVISKNFKGTLKVKLLRKEFIDQKFFYKYDSKGNMKKTLVLKDDKEVCMCLESHLENIFLNVGGVWYDVDKLPRFRVPKAPEITAFSGKDCTEPIEFKTVEYDILKLKSLRTSKYMGHIEAGDISETELNFYYGYSHSEFEHCLNKLTLSDIMIGG